MKKRKSPIVLITLLVLMACVSFGLNFAWSKSAGPGTEQPGPPPEVADAKPIGEPRAAENQHGIGNSIKASMNSAPGGPGGPAGGPDEAQAMARRGGPPGNIPGAPGSPMILNPARPMANVKPQKPKPNDSSTSAQWYEKESAIGSKN